VHKGIAEERIESRLLPGGNLVRALFDRHVMALADRGGASNLIGNRWADLAAAHAATWVGSDQPASAAEEDRLRVSRVDRLDATPQIAAAASKRGLQNPDLLLIGQRDGHEIIQAVDAKFSIETARSKQVSAEVVQGLLELGREVPGLLRGLDERLVVEPGFFLAPDFPLTRLMLVRRHGIVRSTVQPREVVTAPAPPERFWDGVPGATIISPLAEPDALPLRPDESLMVGLYYFRLARAATGFWLEATKPLLLNNDVVAIDEATIRDEAARRARAAASAIEVIQRWDADVDVVRRQRAAVERVAGLPISGRELRDRVASIAAAAGGEAPSVNQVRRRLGAWYRSSLRDRVGAVPPPVANLPAVLRQIASAGREISPDIDRELERVVRELMRSDAADALPDADVPAS
jgi:hypothetical protein